MLKVKWEAKIRARSFKNIFRPKLCGLADKHNSCVYHMIHFDAQWQNNQPGALIELQDKKKR